MKKVLKIIILLFIVLLLITSLPDLSNEYIKKGNLYISKIMAKNETYLVDNNGEYSDFIELYNGYSYPINLMGYNLSDAEYSTNKWTFPNIVISAKESLIIYASGNDVCNIEKRVCHTNFKLSSQGETITLSDASGNIINKFTFPAQYPDIAYGYKDGKYTFLEEAKNIKANTKLKNYKIEITEYMTHNKRSLFDEYGNYYDFVEIHNSSDSDYEVEGLYISDNKDNLKKYLIPKFLMKKDEYKIIYFAGKKVEYDGAYADFSLSDNDKEIIISNGEEMIDKVDIVILPDNVSYGKTKDGWKYFTSATPGAINDTASFVTLGGSHGSS